jgi:hypothetical protein
MLTFVFLGLSVLSLLVSLWPKGRSWLLKLTLLFFGVTIGLAIPLLNTTQAPAKTGAKPSSIDIDKEASKRLPGFLEPYKRWLEEEGDRLRGQNLIEGFTLCTVISKPLSNASQFGWKLEASPGFEVSGLAFRQTKDNAFEPLGPGQNDAGSSLFKVPGCIKGDKLIAIVRVSWKKGGESKIECSVLYHSSVQ